MKKFLPALALVSLLAIPVTGLAQTGLAQEDSCSDFILEADCLEANCMWNPDSGECQGIYVTSASDVITMINKIGNWIFAILMAIAGLMLIYAGFTWVTAGGSSENVMKAKQMLTNAIIGIVVALLAKGVVMAVVAVLGGV